MTPRVRSFWGWGWADRFPGTDERRSTAAMAGAMLGFEGLDARSEPRIEDAVMPASRIAAPSKLAPFCTSEPLERASHTYGKSYRDLVSGFAGDFASAPDLVARPPDEAAIDAVLDWCAHERVAVIPYGGGSSVVGGVSLPERSGWRGVVSLDLGVLDRVLEVDTVSRAARIQAGASGPALERQLAEHGLTLRHFPQSFEHSTLGGWIATRAGGHFATLYTHIDDLVESVRMLTPVGVYESRRLPASGAGPAPDRLVLGSEGTLGVVTHAWMRVQPRPRWRLGATVGFVDLLRAAEALRVLAQSGLYPANCRVLDGREAALNGVPTDGHGALMILGFESADHPLDAWMDRALAIAREHGGEPSSAGITRRDDDGDARTEDGAAGWRKAFLDAPYLLNTLVSVGVLVDTFETACTWDRFPELHARAIADVRAALRRVCGKGIVTCRITHVYPDGPAPYFTFLAPARVGSELSQWAEIKHAASEALLACGATITHHHAVGRVHRPWYDRERPEPFAAALRAVKHALDPAGILNPGVLVDA